MQNIIVSYSVKLLELMGTKIATQLLFPQNTPNEMKLWQAVVLTAFDDVTCNLSDKKSAIAKWEAFKWFHHNEDFEKVCYLADFDADYVRERYWRAVDQDIILFTPKQIAWGRYHEILTAYQSETNKKRRKELREQLEKQRRKVMHASHLSQMQKTTS